MILNGKLEDPRPVSVADRLKLPEIRVRNEVAQLLDGHPITTGRADGIVLDRVDSRTILDVKIRAIEQIESLRLKSERLTFPEPESARDTKVHLNDPRTIEGVQSHGRTWPNSRDSAGRVSRRLKRGTVVQDDTQTIAIIKG